MSGSRVIDHRELDTDKIKSELTQLLTEGNFAESIQNDLPQLKTVTSESVADDMGYNQCDMLTWEHKVQEWKAFCADCKNTMNIVLLQMVEEVEEFIERLDRIAHEVASCLIV